MDTHTGLGRFREFRISNYDLMMNLIDYCHGYGIDDIINLADVKERAKLFNKHVQDFKD